MKNPGERPAAPVRAADGEVTPLPPSPILGPGETLLPGYHVIEHLRRGQSLDVYDVWSEERACRCIAKVLRPDCLHDAAAARRLAREGQILSRLAHPHIVRIFARFSQPQPALILETLTGETLGSVLI
jgi:serine/threonine protein kinase